MKEFEKFLIPISILLAGAIFSGVYFYSEYRKERQSETKDNFVNFCLDDAEKKYWNYMKINGEEKDDGTIFADNQYWDRAEKVKQNDIDLCFKKYK
jgi:N-acetylmuramoyl-L-alanine amidase CwlA